MLLRSHLSWSGSDENMPSKDLDNVRGQLVDACIDADFTYEEWNALSDEERKGYTVMVNLRFELAAAAADYKWQAVKALLDL